MIESSSNASSHVILRIKSQAWAIPAIDVREMVSMPFVMELPETPEFVRGIIFLRGDSIPLIDLRRLIGLESHQNETEKIIELLNQSRKEHIQWLVELESSIRENRSFTLERNPARCPFAKWHEGYNSNDLIVASLVRKFELPHSRLHLSADTALTLFKSGNLHAALDVVDNTRKNDLNFLNFLFDEFIHFIVEAHNEIALVIQRNGTLFAISADSVDSVENLDIDRMEPVPDIITGKYSSQVVGSISKLKNQDEPVLILDSDRLLECLKSIVDEIRLGQ